MCCPLVARAGVHVAHEAVAVATLLVLVSGLELALDAPLSCMWEITQGIVACAADVVPHRLVVVLIRGKLGAQFLAVVGRESINKRSLCPCTPYMCNTVVAV